MVLNQLGSRKRLISKDDFSLSPAEQCFTQPNGGINQEMMGWLLDHTLITHNRFIEPLRHR